MAVVFKNIYFYNDIRQKFKTFKIFKKTWFSPFFWEIFVETQNNPINFIYSHSLKNVNLIICKNTPTTQLTQQLLLFTHYNSLFVYIDASCYKLSNNFYYLTNYNCMLTNSQILFVTKLHKNFNLSIFSVSTFFLGSQWVERELKEFYNLFYVNLNDSRRLLTDYTNNFNTFNFYKTTNYSLISQDLYF